MFIFIRINCFNETLEKCRWRRHFHFLLVISISYNLLFIVAIFASTFRGSPKCAFLGRQWWEVSTTVWPGFNAMFIHCENVFSSAKFLNLWRRPRNDCIKAKFTFKFRARERGASRTSKENRAQVNECWLDSNVLTTQRDRSMGQDGRRWRKNEEFSLRFLSKFHLQVEIQLTMPTHKKRVFRNARFLRGRELWNFSLALFPSHKRKIFFIEHRDENTLKTFNGWFRLGDNENSKIIERSEGYRKVRSGHQHLNSPRPCCLCYYPLEITNYQPTCAVTSLQFGLH